MCLIVSKSGREIDFTEEHFNKAWEANPHGVGFMWAENGKVHVKKTQKKAKGLKLFNALKHKPNFGMHFRFRTSGATDINNTHPFQILKKDEDGIDLFMMHNGVLSVHEPKPQYSDTWHFAKNYLRPILKHNWEYILTAEFDDLISPHIKGSKLLFIYANDKFEGEIIFNKKDGYTREHGTWVSNNNFLYSCRYNTHWGDEYDHYYGSDKYKYSTHTGKVYDTSSGRTYDAETGTQIIGGPKTQTDENLSLDDLFKQQTEESDAQKLLTYRRSLHLEELQGELKILDTVQETYVQINKLTEAELEELIHDSPDKVFLLLECLRAKTSWEDFGMELMELEDALTGDIEEYNKLINDAVGNLDSDAA